MALSSTTIAGDGVTNQYAVPFAYIKRSHVSVTVNGVAAPFTWVNPALVQITTTPPNGAVIVIARDSSKTARLVDYVAGPLDEETLDADSLQAFYLAQEVRDRAEDALGPTNGGVAWDAVSKSIKNVANGVDAQDAVTMGQLAAAAIAPMGTVAIANGGTGATTAANARTALGALSNAAGDVAYSNIQNVSPFRLLGNGTGVAAPIQEYQLDGVTCTFNGSFVRPFTPNGVRQTVFLGPVDSNGLASFGGSTGSTTVTMSGTLVATAAGGVDTLGILDYVGSGTNLSWTGLNTNGTMYLYVDVANASLTPGSTTLAPIYQWGGTYSTVNGQNTFNIQEMTMKVGNGTTSSSVRRVFVGEVTVAGGVVTAIIWYQLQGRYDSGWTTTLPLSTSVTRSSNLGIHPASADLIIECTTTDVSYAVGDRLTTPLWTGVAATNSGAVQGVVVNRNTIGFAAFGSYYVTDKLGAVPGASLTVARWRYKLVCSRGW